MVKNIRWHICLMLLFPVLISGCVSMNENLSGEEGQNAQQELVDAAAVAVRVMCGDADNRSLAVLIANARGILIYPRIFRAGVLFGGEGGKGVLLARDADGKWGNPAFYAMGGGSVGLQIGMQRTSLIMVLMNDRVLESAIRTGVTLGADASFAIGSEGAGLAADSQNVHKDIYCFSNTDGLYAGVSLEGRIINTDHPANRRYYGEDANPEGILLKNSFDNPGALVLRDALNTLQ